MKSRTLGWLALLPILAQCGGAKAADQLLYDNGPDEFTAGSWRDLFGPRRAH